MTPERAELPPVSERPKKENKKVNPVELDEAFGSNPLWQVAWEDFKKTDDYQQLIKSKQISSADLQAIREMNGAFLKRFMRADKKTILPNVLTQEKEHASPDQQEYEFLLGILRSESSLKDLIKAWWNHKNPKTDY